MELRYHSDPDTGLPHIYAHGVTEEEVFEVLTRAGEERQGQDESRIKLGQTAAGRFLRVVFAPDADGIGAFVITAYELRGKPLQAFRRRQRRKRR